MSTSTAVRPALTRVFQFPIASHLPPTFLAPSFQNATQTSPFSTTSINSYRAHRHPRDRGISAIRRTGPRKPLSVAKDPLPVPVLDVKKRSKVVVDDDHGLWDFFHSKEKPFNTPEEDLEFGRPWTTEELRHKSWRDLHCLWWECCKERNRIATEANDRKRMKAGYGDFESQQRDDAIRATQRGIKRALTERYYAWEEARKLADQGFVDDFVDEKDESPFVDEMEEEMEEEEEEEDIEYTTDEEIQREREKDMAQRGIVKEL